MRSIQKYLTALALTSAALVFFGGTHQAHAAVAFDAVGPSAAGTSVASGSSLSWSHTVSGTNTLLTVAVTVGNNTDGGLSLGVTDNGTAMTSAGRVHSNNQSAGYVELFYLKGAPTGANAIQVTLTGGTAILNAGSVSFNGVDQTTPVRNIVTGAGAGTPSLAVTSAAGDMVVSALANGDSITTSGQTLRWLHNVNATTAGGNGAESTAPGAASVTMNYTVSADWWGMIGFDIAAASGGGGGGDTIAPSTPSGLSATAVSSSAINLSWTASTDNVGVTGYKIFRGGVQVGTSATNSYSDSGLTASTNYSYTVQAYDAAGNNSAQSSSASATTQAVQQSDTQAPSIPAGLSATAISSSAINLTWTASTDNVGVTGYKLFRAGMQIGTSASASYSDSGLTASTNYSYTVSAYDAAGNNSAQSSSASATTQASQSQGLDCSSSAAVQTALNAASSGSTVTCGSTGQYTWSTTVNIPSTKNITFNANGSTITGHLTLPSSATFQARVTNITFRIDDSINTTGDASINLPWRLDHCTFDASGTDSNAMMTTGSGPGLIDHCSFINLPLAKETIHNTGWGPGNLSGWMDAIIPGQAASLYIESNTVTGAQYSNLMQNYYGARAVVRFNTFNGPQVDFHGDATGPSTRWWEEYDNSLTGGSLLCQRGGSGVIFGNTGTSYAIFINETANNAHGIGHGQNDNSTPAYLSNNGPMTYIYNQDGCSVHLGTVNVGVDVRVAASGTTLPATCALNDGFLKTNDGTWNQSGSGGQGVLYKCIATNTWTSYMTPFTYPYPLNASGMPNPSGGGTTQTFTITASAGSNGSISPSGAVSVNSGASQTFTVTANSGYQVASVTVDGVLASLTGGAYTFSNVTADHTISVSFSSINAPDTTAPTISITSPLNGSTVSGSSVSFAANATDPVIANQISSGVASVQFKLDGSNITGGLFTTAPYSGTWNTTGVTNGTHSMTATAIDGAGNTTTSSAISITVNNVVTPIIGDFNHDGLVNSLDLSLLLGAWNTNNATYDLNSDGAVNSLDYALMIQHWSP